MIEEKYSDWRQELESHKQATYLQVVSGSNFTAEFPASLSPPEFVERLIAGLGKTLTQAEHTQLVNHLTANNTRAGRAFVLQEIDTQHN